MAHDRAVAHYQRLAHQADALRAAQVDVSALTAHAVLESNVPALLTVLFAGDDRQASRALHRLRELAVVEQTPQLELPLCAA